MSNIITLDRKPADIERIIDLLVNNVDLVRGLVVIATVETPGSQPHMEIYAAATPLEFYRAHRVLGEEIAKDDL